MFGTRPAPALLPAEKLRDHFGKYGQIVEAVGAGWEVRVHPLHQPQRATKAALRPAGRDARSPDGQASRLWIRDVHCPRSRRRGRAGRPCDRRSPGACPASPLCSWLAPLLACVRRQGGAAGCIVINSDRPAPGHRCAPQIDAKKSVPQELKPKARKVFVGGLSPETTEGALARGARAPTGPALAAAGRPAGLVCAVECQDACPASFRAARPRGGDRRPRRDAFQPAP